jgi:hypothetical protein
MPDTITTEALPATIAALLRYAVSAFGAFAVGKGWVSPESLPGVAAMIVSIATVAYGLWKTHSRQTKLVAATSSR